MKTISLSIDAEPDMHTGSYKGILALKKFSLILDKRKIKATFFATCDCIRKYPEIFRHLKKHGHEISLHGFSHVRFDRLPEKEKISQIKKSLDCFKKYLDIKPSGFRAPQHSIDKETLDILKKYNFKYDSSYSPWNFFHMILSRKNVRFSHNFTPQKIYKIRKNLYEIPISTFILPVSALALRALPVWMLRKFIFLIKCKKNIVFMMHSWDLIEIPESRLYKKCPLPEFLKKFEIFLDSFPSSRFKKLDELIPPVKA